jgi:hypothetical protein
MIDVIFLSFTKNLHYYGLTQRSINTLIQNNQDVDFNIFVVETNKKIIDEFFVYRDCNVLIPDEDFNYNRFIQYGLNFCKNDYVLICNNDLIFTKDSIKNLVNIVKTYNIESASPIEPNFHNNLFSEKEMQSDFIEGYEVQKHILGWCIILKRNLIKKFNLFDEEFSFWYQDDDYAMELKKNGIKHFLIPSSKVRHEFSASHTLLKEKETMTYGLKKKFDEKWN